jgi:hypothetical protein
VPTDEEVFAIKERAEARLFAIPGVAAVGIGGRERAGRPTGEVVIKVYVVAKHPRAEVPQGELIPPVFEGIPTDVAILSAEGELTQAPTGKPEIPIADIDDRRQRPLLGGSRVQVALTGSGIGTIACLFRDTADATKAYALTNFHVLRTAAEAPVVGTTRAGQPTSQDSSTKCCSAIIGTFAGGGYAVRDSALVRLDPGMEWRADILEVGAVSGTHNISVTEAATLTYPVRKRGARSGLTGGTVESIATTWTIEGTVFSNLIIVKPNPNPTIPAGAMNYFQQGGDSGAALVNDAREVVGLMKSKGDVGTISKGAAIPIADVITGFLTNESLSVAVATAATPGIVNTVPGAAMVTVPPEVVSVLQPIGEGIRAADEPSPLRVPVGAPLLGGLPVEPGLALAGVQRDLDASESGRFLITFWLLHQEELLVLINTNRKVAAVWHRSGAAAAVQVLARMIGRPDVVLPETLHGRPLNRCLDQLHEILDRFASPRLSEDLGQVRRLVPDPAGMTYPQLIDALGSA